MKSILRMTALGLGLAIAAVANPLGSGAAKAEDAIRLAVTDIEGLEGLQREFGAFRDVLAEKTGLSFKFFPVANRTAAAEALKAEKVDMVLTGPAEYVVIRKKTDAKAVVGFSRPDYFADVIVLADSGIDSVMDLKGKKVALGSVGSTSKHLAPMQLIADGGLSRGDIQPMHVSIKVGFEALKRGDVAAFATTNDKFLKLRKNEAELAAGAFKVIARGRDLPNDVLMAARHMDEATVKKIRSVFVDHSDDLVAAILTGEDNKKYTGMKFLAGVKDSDYDYVRSMYATIGYPQFAEFVGN
ncbi:MAG: PhnD/SsuA/transferrin family substrate-binding protein [Magnetovibrionaceae bacterium]